GRCEDHPRCAEAALCGVAIVERRLDGGHALCLAEALERRDRGAVDGHDRCETRATRLPVDEHGAGATTALLAARLRARDLELLPQNVEERGERRARDFLLDPVDRQPHALSSSSSARRTSTTSILRRYSADATASSTGSASLSTSSGFRLCSTVRQRTAVAPIPDTPIRRPSPAAHTATFAIAYECACRRR